MQNLVAYYRRQKKIKQTEMARRLEVTPSYLCKIERGLQKPTEKFKRSCAEILGEDLRLIFPKKIKNSDIKSLSRSFSNKLWTIRREKKMKQTELAKKLECSPSFLSKIETGMQKPPENFKAKCAKILKVKVTEIFPNNM